MLYERANFCAVCGYPLTSLATCTNNTCSMQAQEQLLGIQEKTITVHNYSILSRLMDKAAMLNHITKQAETLSKCYDIMLAIVRSFNGTKVNLTTEQMDIYLQLLENYSRAKDLRLKLATQATVSLHAGW